MKSFFRSISQPFRDKDDRGRIWFWFKCLAIPFFSLQFLVLGVIAFYTLNLPSLESLERIEPSLITRVYDRDTLLVHEFYTQRRVWMPYEDIPEMAMRSVFAVEDKDFHSHWGVDLDAVPKALIPGLFGQRIRGASTLTQQLAKNLFLTPERSFARKVKEVLVALKIEQTYTKAEILEFYFSQVYMGAGAYGFEAASQKYFSKSLAELEPHQYALLAGLLQRPEAYRPDVHPERALARRNTVLGAMRSAGVLTRAQSVEAAARPLDIEVKAPQSAFAAYFVEMGRQFMEKKWGEDLIYNQGASVYTTLDSGVQAVVESVFTANLEKIQRRIRYRTARQLDMPRLLKRNIDLVVRHWDETYPLFDSLYLRADTLEKKRFPDSLRYRHAQAALVLLDNPTGAIRALVGGEDYQASKYNRAVQAKRSPGSSFKPFVYAAAVDNGAGPGEMLNDQPITIPDPTDSTKMWRPHNYEDEFEGKIDMRRALYRSKNLPAIETGMRFGLNTIVSYARKFGLKHNVPAVPSLSIGSAEATLMEMTSAYTAFPGLGVRPEPYLIEVIADKNGRSIYNNVSATHEVLSRQAAWIMTTMLVDVNIRGTAASVWASGFNYPSGGKTGTTNDYTDAWYIGFTPHYTLGVWVGVDSNMPLGPGHTGTSDALPMWLGVMRSLHKDLPLQGFTRPEGVIQARTCRLSGLVAQDFCPAYNEDFYIQGSQPSETCQPELHSHRAHEDVFNANQRRQRSDSPVSGEDTSPRIRKTF